MKSITKITINERSIYKKNFNKIIMNIFILLLKHKKCYLFGNIIFKSIVFYII